MSIPQSQIDLFNSLAAQNLLYGVPAIILEAIDLAESGGTPGYVNAEGYGGLFGLAANTPYKGGTLSPGELAGTDEQSIQIQAIICASEFANLLDQNGGNVYAAETTYQGGSSEGVGIMQSMGIPATIQWPPPPPPPPQQEHGMFFLNNGNVYFVAGLLFSWDGDTYFANAGGGVKLGPNALAAVKPLHVVADVEAGLYNALVSGKTGKPHAVKLGAHAVSAMQADAKAGHSTIVADVSNALLNLFAG